MQDILLPFPPGTTRAVFLRREKRFLALVSLNGREVWTHTNNSGSMLGLLRPGSPALISPAAGPGRKLEWTLEALHCDGSWICVNTLAPNRTLRAAWQAGLLPEAAGTTSFRAEAKVGDSRLDALLSGPGGDIWVEAKNVTLEFCGTACFPDAVTERGQKHLRELMALAAQGLRTAVFYFVPMVCAERFAPADFIDPNYAALFREALSRGVEAWPYRALVDERGIRLDCRLPLAGS